MGPIAVLGVDGFVGASLLRDLCQNTDAVGTSPAGPSWQTEGIPEDKIRQFDAVDLEALRAFLASVQPRSIVSCISLAGEANADVDSPYRSRLAVASICLEHLARFAGSTFLQLEWLHPGESVPSAMPARMASEALLRDRSAVGGVRTAVLRLAEPFGPYQDPGSTVARYLDYGAKKQYPNDIACADILGIDDIVSAIRTVIASAPSGPAGATLDVSYGITTTGHTLGSLARQRYGIEAEPPSETSQAADGDAVKYDLLSARSNWRPAQTIAEAFNRAADWFDGLKDQETYLRRASDRALDKRWSISAVVLCWHENPTIPYMYQRATETFLKLGVDYEIIFVNNDNAPDDAEEMVRELSSRDPRVVGLSLSRNWSPPAAMLDGVRLASKNAVVTMDGDLQDPPEMIEQFLELWKQGNEVVYGRRVNRVAPWHIRVLSKAYYRILSRLSNIEIPQDAGEFALMDRRVVDWLNSFPERELFPRGLRAYVGFRQAGVDYVRPERMFGTSSNNMARLVNTAKIGIFQFSSAPLTMVTYTGFWLLMLSLLLAAREIFGRLIGLLTHQPGPPQGYTTLFVLILFFGSLNLFAIGIAAEYIGKIFEEVKQRPRVIRRGVVRNGKIDRNDYWNQTEDYRRNLGRDLG
jgi:dolichol-phosphate mannosyltransferase